MDSAKKQKQKSKLAYWPVGTCCWCQPGQPIRAHIGREIAIKRHNKRNEDLLEDISLIC